MNLDDFPLAAFEVDCDGSACGSHVGRRYIHPPQNGRPAICRVVITDGRRERYEETR